MKFQLNPRYLLAVVAVLVMAVALACGGGNDSDEFSVVSTVTVSRGVVVESQSGPAALVAGHLAPPAAAATAAPAAAALQSSGSTRGDDQNVVTLSKGDKEDAAFETAGESSGSGSASIENEIAAATEGRVIVRTADLGVNVDSVPETLDDISKIPTSLKRTNVCIGFF